MNMRFRDMYTLSLNALLVVALTIALGLLLAQAHAAERGGTVVTTGVSNSSLAGPQPGAPGCRYV